MQSDTRTVFIQRPADELFDFLAQPQNLPVWATEFCSDIRPHGNAWLATTPNGEITVRYRTDSEFGIVDYLLSPAPGIELLAASRVLPNDDGAEYTFTQFQAPGMPDAAFGAQVDALRLELANLKHLMERG